ncbi:hypothetical protein BC938DRAFT_474520 [Jimgerdemannia flammicorona]|uniref:Lysosomal dipeptide transporter MFSD1 n=1 Tax=Jimgerdemannia flammicorona TaxID=994334 RepID=A0A433Q212_9FUNG|nr:hypothetical protein BC938DRAFT_474520 [Jimgerdemannia flammicorona]
MTFDNNPSRPPPVDVPARDTAAITATGAISPTEEVRRRWSTSAPPFRPGIDDDDDGGDVPAVLPVQDADHTDPGYAGLHASKGCVGEIKTMADGDMMLDLEKRSDEHTWLRIYALVCACTFGIGSHYAVSGWSAMRWGGGFVGIWAESAVWECEEPRTCSAYGRSAKRRSKTGTCSYSSLQTPLPQKPSTGNPHLPHPLPPHISQELGATNAQFSLLQSSLTLFPTILPLVGGIFVERFGAGPSSIAFSSFILLGQVLVLLATWTGNVNGMVGGFMIFGIGSGPIVTVQETILINFFKGQGLSLALGVGLMSGKIVRSSHSLPPFQPNSAAQYFLPSNPSIPSTLFPFHRPPFLPPSPPFPSPVSLPFISTPLSSSPPSSAFALGL